jgi:hypothetical protein
MDQHTDLAASASATPPDLPGLPPAALVEIAGFALRRARADGPVIKALNRLGGGIEARYATLPPAARRALEQGLGEMLEQVYRAAAFAARHPKMPETGNWAHGVAVAAGGALGGVGGIGTALVELPATVALLFGAMQKIAGEYGFDPAADEVRLTCLDIFGSGGPGMADDGVNTAFLGARLTLSGSGVQALVRQVAPAFAAVIGRKLAGQVVPVMGAAAGAGINLAYLSYYRDMAHIRFGLQRLALRHGIEPIRAQYEADVARLIAR